MQLYGDAKLVYCFFWSSFSGDTEKETDLYVMQKLVTKVEIGHSTYTNHEALFGNFQNIRKTD